ncbi:MAG: hypothetical protein ACK56I_14280, partial [bacterium]
RSGYRPPAPPPPSTREGRHRHLDSGMGGSGRRAPGRVRRLGSGGERRLQWSRDSPHPGPR